MFSVSKIKHGNKTYEVGCKTYEVNRKVYEPSCTKKLWGWFKKKHEVGTEQRRSVAEQRRLVAEQRRSVAEQTEEVGCRAEEFGCRTEEIGCRTEEVSINYMYMYNETGCTKNFMWSVVNKQVL